MVVGETYARTRVTAADLKAEGAMTTLLKDALMPNLVQTLEHVPAFVHGGPFGNIAHGCNSLIATRLGQRLSEYTVTEAGFGSDLGAEKFFDIKCRAGGLRPDAAVLVATLRALKFQAGVPLEDVGKPNPEAVEKALPHLAKHVENVSSFGVPLVVALNAFTSDTDEEVDVLRRAAAGLGVDVVRADHWARGGAGAEDLARSVVALAESGRSAFQPIYPDDMHLLAKIETVARKVYGAEGIVADTVLRNRIKKLEADGFGHLPVCMAKTQYSLSTDPKLKGRPRNFHVPLRAVELRAGAGFVLVLTGDVMTMPGLPKVPAAEAIDVGSDGQVVGLF